MSTLLTRLRVIFYTGPMIILATAVMGSISLFISLFDSSGNGQHACARIWSRMLLWIARVRVEVEGKEKLEPGGSYVFVANHRSFFDIPCILPQIATQFRFMAIKYLFKVPFIGYHLRRAGHLQVDSSNVRDSLRSMSAAARIIQETGISILIFPEGGRTDGELRPFKDGAAYVAIKAGVPIVPIMMKGTREILPMGSLLIRGGVVKMQIGDPIPTIDLSLRDRTELSNSLREFMIETHQPDPEKQHV